MSSFEALMSVFYTFPGMGRRRSVDASVFAFNRIYSQFEINELTLPITGKEYWSIRQTNFPIYTTYSTGTLCFKPGALSPTFIEDTSGIMGYLSVRNSICNDNLLPIRKYLLSIIEPNTRSSNKINLEKTYMYFDITPDQLNAFLNGWRITPETEYKITTKYQTIWNDLTAVRVISDDDIREILKGLKDKDKYTRKAIANRLGGKSESSLDNFIKGTNGQCIADEFRRFYERYPLDEYTVDTVANTLMRKSQ